LNHSSPQSKSMTASRPLSAWALKSAWPEAHLDVVPDAGHASTEPGIVDSLLRATDWAATL
jgi:proline iminopeptidase